jgi:hypothetical protein
MWTPTTSRYHFSFCPMITANECKYDYRSSSERDTERYSEQLRYGYRIGPEGDRKCPPSIITEISQWRISPPKDFTWRSRGVPGALQNYSGQMPYRTESRITLPEAYQMTTEKPTDILPKLPTEMAAEKSTKKSTTKLTGKVYQVDEDSLKHWRYWNQPPPEDFHWGRRIRGRRWQQKIVGKDHGRSEKISTELPTELPTKKQSTKLPTEKESTEMSTKKLTGRSPTLIPNQITEKHLHANCWWLPICLIPHEDYRYCIKYAEALYEGSEAHLNTWWVSSPSEMLIW